MNNSHKIIIDDEPLNADILEEYLSDMGFRTLCAYDGEEGWQTLQDNPDTRVILLDRMMPGMDGLAFMKKLTAERRFRDIPVIMQTAASSSQEILEGLKAGVFYYLTKPFDKDIITSVVKAAVENSRNLLQVETRRESDESQIMDLMRSCEFTFRTMEEAESICRHIADMCPEPDKALIGLCELSYNAIEHGNLDISFEEKNNLILEGRLKAEIARRLDSPEYRNRMATLTLHKKSDHIHITIRDEGKGFDVSPFIDLNPLKVTKLNGGGIAIARLYSFSELSYNETGNVVTCHVDLYPSTDITQKNQAPAA